MLLAQHQLGERVASSARDRGIRAGCLAGAVLVAASTAALVAYGLLAEDDVGSDVEAAAIVEPLSQEVRAGLPAAPGRYPVRAASVQRDARGVYHFAWRDPASPGGAERFASASLLRLAEGQADELEIVTQGDPILHLRPDTPIGIVPAPSASQPTRSTTGSVYGPSWYWHPFIGSTTTTPVYRDPPPVADGSSGGGVRGSVVSTAPPPAAQRIVNVPGIANAVSGQARGTGSGSAATQKSGVSAVKSSISPPRSTGFSLGIGSRSSGSSVG